MPPAAIAPGPFDRTAILRARARSAGNFRDFSFLHRHALASLSDRLEDVTRDFDLALISGAGGETLLPFSSRKTRRRIRMDLSAARLAQGNGASVAEPGIQADIESLPIGENSVDLAISLLELHTANDLPGALIQIRRTLRPGGLFLGALFGGATLGELRTVLAESEIALRGGLSPRVFPFADAAQMAALMQRAGFSLPVVDTERVRATYPDLSGLLRDLRGMGETNTLAARARGFTGRALFAEAQRRYRTRFADDGDGGRIPATFEIIFLSGWSP